MVKSGIFIRLPASLKRNHFSLKADVMLKTGMLQKVTYVQQKLVQIPPEVFRKSDCHFLTQNRKKARFFLRKISCFSETKWLFWIWDVTEIVLWSQEKIAKYFFVTAYSKVLDVLFCPKKPQRAFGKSSVLSRNTSFTELICVEESSTQFSKKDWITKNRLRFDKFVATMSKKVESRQNRHIISFLPDDQMIAFIRKMLFWRTQVLPKSLSTSQKLSKIIQGTQKPDVASVIPSDKTWQKLLVQQNSTSLCIWGSHLKT